MSDVVKNITHFLIRETIGEFDFNEYIAILSHKRIFSNIIR